MEKGIEGVGSEGNMVPGLVLGQVSCRDLSFSLSLGSQGCGMGWERTRYCHPP